MPVERLEEVIRERRAATAGIAKAALWLAFSMDEQELAQELLQHFDLCEDDIRNADAVERIEHNGADVDDVLELLED